jgi:DNA-binding PadR family transcriptional regulator
MKNYQSLWDVAVLALLREAPMHPYQMQRLLGERHKDELLVLKRGSLYHAIHRLMAAGLIEARGTSRSGRRPERTTYRITAEGRCELIRALEQLVGVPRRESSDFMAALSFLPHLSHQDAIAKLTERARLLEEEARALDAGLKSTLEQVRRIHLIESEYLLAMRRAELKWVRALIEDLRSKELAWDMKLFQEAAGRRKAAAKERSK